MQGRQHYIPTQYNNYDVNIQKKQDEFKQQYAIQHNMNYIAINCITSNFHQIKNNIINSNLNQIYDLTQLNWDEIEKQIKCDNLTLKICEMYETQDITEIAISKKFLVSKDVVTRALQTGAQYGLCPSYIPKGKRKVNVYDEEYKFIGQYESYAMCARQLNQIYPTKNFKEDGISKTVLGQQKSHRGFYFKRIEE